ncbi:CIA30 family protein [Nodosilinea sp. E11]|uniref:CIA30 family protein n=1 Tax=Nodosilinea sp. E11 TaxID=3037479 RepID=UPI0029346CD6|nr:CIA30 family protein [Nodosilinea sp. E11]WOD41085.1 CIA30 family protein [Nodosilinea sp. E11]
MTTAVDTTHLAPARSVGLWGAGHDGADALGQALAPLGYSLTPPGWSSQPDQPLVNLPLVVGLGPSDATWASRLEHLGHVASYQEATLFDFQALDPAIAALWGSLDDGVMGGVSASQVQWQNGLRFVGQVSTANSGGFASIRTRNLEPPLNLSQWQGTVLYAQGDGQRYKWILRDNPDWDSLAYCYSFDTDSDRPITVRTPFLDPVATRRARTVPEASALNPAQVYSMQLMLSKFEYDGDLNPSFEPGSFELTVQRLAVYRQGPKPVLVLPQGNAALGPQLAAAGLTGVVPQGQGAQGPGFEVIGANQTLPPEVSPAAVETILQQLM